MMNTKSLAPVGFELDQEMAWDVESDHTKDETAATTKSTYRNIPLQTSFVEALYDSVLNKIESKLKIKKTSIPTILTDPIYQKILNAHKNVKPFVSGGFDSYLIVGMGPSDLLQELSDEEVEGLKKRFQVDGLLALRVRVYLNRKDAIRVGDYYPSCLLEIELKDGLSETPVWEDKVNSENTAEKLVQISGVSDLKSLQSAIEIACNRASDMLIDQTLERFNPHARYW